MKLEPEVRESLIRRLEFARAELEDLQPLRKIDYFTYQKNRFQRRNVERIIENICNALVDVAKIILAQTETPVPGTYREAILVLGEQEVISLELAKELSQKMRLRNVLAHQYLDLKWEAIQDFLLTGVEQVELFLSSFDRWLEHHDDD